MGRCQLPVDLSAVAQLHHQNPQSTVLNVADHPKIADAITPQPTQWTSQGLARAAWVIPSNHPLIHKI